jgi:hypothetical protein
MRPLEDPAARRTSPLGPANIRGLRAGSRTLRSLYPNVTTRFAAVAAF